MNKNSLKNIKILNLSKCELLLQLFKNCGNFNIFLLYFYKKYPQFFNLKFTFT